MSKEINPPAFPVVGCTITDDYLQEGMTLRDYFAAKAMVSLIGNETLRMSLISDPPKPVSHAYCSKEAYGIADAMLKERQK